MVFVFDLDDTVCETDLYSEQYIANFFKTHNLPYKFVQKNTRFAEAKFDWPMDEALKWYKTYGDQMMLEFPAKPGAIETINALFDAGHTIIIATARAADWHTNPVEITEQWLKQNGVKHTKLYTGRIDKEAICADENADFFIDDDVKFTAKVAELLQEGKTTCKPLLMTSAYNQSLESASGVTRISDFNHFATLLKANGVNLNVNTKQK